jgi:signal recognition particle receptor subunit beta
LVVCNKQDASDAKKPEEIAEKLDFSKALSKRQWKNVGCSSVTGDHIQEGINWFAGEIKKIKTKK